MAIKIMSKRILSVAQDVVKFFPPMMAIDELARLYPKLSRDDAERYISLAQTKIEERILNASERSVMLKTKSRGYEFFLKNLFGG